MLFDPSSVRSLQLANRMVMAPLTRSRATPQHTPNALMTTCYGQRATVAAIGRDRVGIRLSPYGVFNGTGEFPEVQAQYLTLAHALSALGLIYVHLVDHSSMGAPLNAPDEATFYVPGAHGYTDCPALAA